MGLSFGSNLLILVFYKYFGFIVESLNSIFEPLGIQLLQPAFDILLPVGISFYTFQALSYTMDVYRGEVAVEKNIARYALFVSFFPQLVAGPIERSKNLISQIYEKHCFDYDRIRGGLILMLFGFFKKMVIADRIAIVVNGVFDNYGLFNSVQIIIGVILFAFQIYCDFSGYSDIAQGAAKVMGFRLMDNFRQPYFAASIREFWQRWHISLSTWFRDYLYIPLGGNRCSKLRKYFNIMVVFLTSGLWHGAGWNYIVWGGLHGIYQIVGELLHGLKSKMYDKFANNNITSFLLQAGKIAVTFVLVNFAWIFFRAPSVGEAFRIIERIFITHSFVDFLYDITKSSLFEVVGREEFFILGSSALLLLIFDYFNRKSPAIDKLTSLNFIFRWGTYIAITLSILIFGVYGGEYEQTQFIYFQF